MMTDPIADFLTRIRNSGLSHKKNLKLPHSKLKESLALLLLKQGYLQDVKINNNKKTHIFIEVVLKYDGKLPRINEIQKMSKPGRRVYVSKKNIPSILGGKGSAIISTSKGLMVGSEAKKNGLGGEYICKIW